MRRREFIAGRGGAAACPLAAQRSRVVTALQLRSPHEPRDAPIGAFSRASSTPMGAPRQDDDPSQNGIAHVAFNQEHGLRSCDKPISWLNHTPHATAVYASRPT